MPHRITVPRDELDPSVNTRQDALDAQVYDHEVEAAFDDMLDDVYGHVEVAGYEYSTSRALRELDPVAYRCELANFDSANYEEIDVNDFPETHDDEED